MSDISKIKIGETEYDIKDKTARQSIENIPNIVSEYLEENKENLGGKDGVGIAKIEKTSTEELVDTYTITFTDNTTTTFIVTNGKNGKDGTGSEISEGQIATAIKEYLENNPISSGEDGFSPIISVEETEEGYSIEITDKDKTENIILKNGKNGKDGVDGTNGADGVGIEDIVKTSTDGLIDTYTITLTNNETTTFEVVNGTNGIDGKNGLDGSNGSDGRDGVGVESVTKTATEGLVDTYTITLTNGNTSTFEVTNGRDGVVTEEQNEKLNAIGNVETLTQNGFSDVISALFSLKEIIDNMVSIGEMKDNVITLFDIESGQYTLRYEDDNENILEDFEMFSGKNESYSLEVL